MAATAKLRRLAKTVSRQPEWILALAISLAVVWLHFFFLRHAGGFWRDEVNLINLSGSTFAGGNVEGFVSGADAAAGQRLDGHRPGPK